MNRPGPRAFLLAGLLCAAATPAVAAPTLVTTATWQSNATNADRASDQIGALQLAAEASVARRFGLAAYDGLTVGGALQVETWPRFDGLDLATVSAESAWTHKAGLGPAAPSFGLSLALGGTAARESGRAGAFVAGRAFWRRRLGEAWAVSLAQEHRRFDARAGVFDRTGDETTIEVRYELSADWTLAGIAQLRFGDVVSYATPPRPDIVALERTRVAVTTFDRPMVAYSLHARTLAGGLAVERALGERSSLRFGWSYRVTRKSPLRYGNHLVSAALIHQF